MFRLYDTASGEVRELLAGQHIGLAGDVVGEWGSRSLRMFVVGAPPLYVMQWVTGASRPADGGGSQWHSFADNNGVSGHAFIGAIPFLAAADMVESPLLKGTLYVCSTFVGFSRMTDNAHYPSQVFLGWYLAWASSRAAHGRWHWLQNAQSEAGLQRAESIGPAVQPLQKGVWTLAGGL